MRFEEERSSGLHVYVTFPSLDVQLKRGREPDVRERRENGHVGPAQQVRGSFKGSIAALQGSNQEHLCSRHLILVHVVSSLLSQLVFISIHDDLADVFLLAGLLHSNNPLWFETGKRNGTVNVYVWPVGGASCTKVTASKVYLGNLWLSCQSWLFL